MSAPSTVSTAFAANRGSGSWLTRIAVNEALQRRRRRRACEPWDDAAVERGAQVVAFPGAEPPPDPETSAARGQLRAVIEAAVERLPAPLRLVFVLRDMEELSTAETAAQLDLGEATVKTRLHRARRQLRSQLDIEIADSLTGAFPFAGARCACMAERVVARLNGAPPQR